MLGFTVGCTVIVASHRSDKRLKFTRIQMENSMS